METILRQINAVPGVVGSMVCDDDGRLQAKAFPQLYDASLLEDAALVLSDSGLGVENTTGAVQLLDLRFNEARVVIKPMPKASLLLLCTKTVNMQLLGISLTVAVKKVEKLLAERHLQKDANVFTPEKVSTPASSADLTTESVSARAGSGTGVTLKVQAMKTTPNTYWDNMLEMVTINRSTSILISDFFRSGPFKKLKLTNTVNGRSRKFPVYVIKDDAERLFDNKAVVSLASMESLGVHPGDDVVATIEIGGGLFGWEGI